MCVCVFVCVCVYAVTFSSELKIVPQIVVAPEAQADVEYDDCSSGKTYSSVSETENDEMRSIDTWSAFTHMEEFTFPLLSWRTYV